eukprot:CAMPEP_0172196338 /NCGR_PEP_ID=MMETSP1050-20130122/26757_1 /TAXON_ID=233186 /ORGANISM="Cryptomonas curvata, Strain CCAP979/52" /LENGTH=42 /DNA_ID= /DNA_START= /DNA_END= /DNA_ORIENTATION=
MAQQRESALANTHSERMRSAADPPARHSERAASSSALRALSS